MSQNIDISYIFDKEEPTVEVVLHIKPDAPLSMVSSPSGNFLATLTKPTNNMIYGLIENVIGIHASRSDRETILKKVYGKKFIISEYISFKYNKAYLPLIFKQVEVNEITIPEYTKFIDVTTQHWRRKNEYPHYNGVRHIDASIVNLDYKPNQKNSEYVKPLMDKLPLYYSTLKKREYVLYKSSETNEGNIQCKMKLAPTLYRELESALVQRSAAYLGSSDGIVSLYLEKI